MAGSMLSAGQLAAVDKLLIDIEIQIRNANKFKELDAWLLKIEKDLNRLTKEKLTKFSNLARSTQNFLLGMGMSFLFTGMQIKNFFQSMLTDLYASFTMVEGQGSITNEKFYELQALLEFTKWSLIDAFADSGMLDTWLKRISSFLDYINDLSPATKAWLVNMAVWGVIAGLAMMVLGGFLLFLLGPLAFAKVALVETGLIAKTSFATFASGALIAAGIVLTLLAGLVLIGLIATSNMEPWRKFFLMMGVSMVALMISAKLLGITFAAAFWPITLISIAISGFILLTEYAGGVGNAFAAMGLVILLVLGIVADALYNLFIAPLRVAILLLNGFIAAYNFFHPNDKMATIDQPEWLPVTGMVMELRNQLLAKVQADKDAAALPGIQAAAHAQAAADRAAAGGAATGVISTGNADLDRYNAQIAASQLAVAAQQAQLDEMIAQQRIDNLRNWATGSNGTTVNVNIEGSLLTLKSMAEEVKKTIVDELGHGTGSPQVT